MNQELSSMEQDMLIEFSDASDERLIECFNNEVGKKSWTSAKGLFIKALVEKMKERHWDVSAIFDGESIDLAKPIALKDKCLYQIDVHSNS